MATMFVVNPFVKLIRDAKIEQMIHCFICDSVQIQNNYKTEHHTQMIILFKSFLLNSYQDSGEISSSKKAKIEDNVQSCSNCFSSILSVWNLHQQIVSLQRDIDKVVELCRITNINEIPEAKSCPTPTEDNLSSWTFLGIGLEDDDDDSIHGKNPLQHNDTFENDIDVEFGVEIGSVTQENERVKSIPVRRIKINQPTVLNQADIEIKTEREDYPAPNCNSDDNYDPSLSSDESDSDYDDTETAASPRPSKKRTYLYKRMDPANPRSKVAKSLRTIKRIRFSSVDEKLKPVPNSDGIYNCSKCSKTFKNWRSVLSHEITVCKIPHDKEKLDAIHFKLFECDKCDAIFAFPKDLARHKNKHTLAKPFTCEKCGSSYSQKQTLTQHQKVWCSAVEIDPDVVKQHKNRIKSNFGRRLKNSKFQCDQCPEKFATQAKLDLHAKIPHDMPFRVDCDICGESVRRRRLRVHQKDVHGIAVKHTCDFCGKGFFDRPGLLRHCRDTHKDKYAGVRGRYKKRGTKQKQPSSDSDSSGDEVEISDEDTVK